MKVRRMMLMDNSIIVALIGLAGSGLGAFGGVMASAWKG